MSDGKHQEEIERHKRTLWLIEQEYLNIDTLREQCAMDLMHLQENAKSALASRIRRMRAAMRGNHPNMLVIDTQCPSPTFDSGSVRAIRLLRLFRKLGCHITFLTATPEAGWEHAGLLQKEGVRILNRAPAQHLAEEGKNYDIILLSRAPTAALFLEDARLYAPNAYVVFDSVDLHALRCKRQQAWAEIRSEHPFEAEYQKYLEDFLVRNADCTLVVSEFEQSHLKEEHPEAKTLLLSNIHDTPGTNTPFEERNDLLFLGSFRHEPNVDALRYFVEDIFPEVLSLLPETTLHVIGQYDDEDIGHLAGERVVLHGHVPDIEPWLDRVKLSVAPLRFGAGVKGKINTSLSHGLPVVTTTVGAEGMHLKNNENCLIADEPAAFAKAIEQLCTGKELWQKLSKAGMENTRRYFSPSIAEKQCRTMLNNATEKQKALRKKTTPRVCAVIPTAANNLPMIKRCLRTLRRAAKGVRLRTVLVVCPGTEEKGNALRAITREQEEVLCLDPPFSFAKSNNAGLEQLQDEEYVLFLNDDCFFRTRDALLQLIHATNMEQIAYAGPWMNHKYHAEELPYERRDIATTHTKHPIIGACLLWKREWLERTGYFDESFSGYGMEEADLSFRTLQEGGRWLRTDAVEVDHIHHASFGGSIKDQEPHKRNMRRWKEKFPGVHSWGESPDWDHNFDVSGENTDANCNMGLRRYCEYRLSTLKFFQKKYTKRLHSIHIPLLQRVFGTMKWLWTLCGEPFPRQIRFVRHALLGRFAPRKKD